MKRAALWIALMPILALLTLPVYGISSGRTPRVQLDVLAEEMAQYQITFTSTWSSETHPSENFPAGAHFSRLIGATHNQSVIFWQSGSLATAGIEDMAEKGNNSQLKNEVGAAIGAGTADQFLLGDGLGSATGTIVLESVDLHQDYPLVTLVTMIAPSPDWFVGVSGVSLLDGEGKWINSKEVTLYPYDAGTDDGTDYGSPNADSDPAEPIVNISGKAPFSSLPIGTLTFTRINAPDPTATPTQTSMPVETVVPTKTAIPLPTATPTPILCPRATAEPFMVGYLSPTELTTQTLSVHIGNGDAVTVTAPSGIYTSTGDYTFALPARVTVDLLSDQINEMTVAAHVRAVTQGTCAYGNYTLTEKISIRQQTSPIFRIFAPLIQQ